MRLALPRAIPGETGMPNRITLAMSVSSQENLSFLTQATSLYALACRLLLRRATLVPIRCFQKNATQKSLPPCHPEEPRPRGNSSSWQARMVKTIHFSARYQAQRHVLQRHVLPEVPSPRVFPDAPASRIRVFHAFGQGLMAAVLGCQPVLRGCHSTVACCVVAKLRQIEQTERMPCASRRRIPRRQGHRPLRGKAVLPQASKAHSKVKTAAKFWMGTALAKVEGRIPLSCEKAYRQGA